MIGGSATTTGLQGEFITLAAILDLGWKAGHAPMDGVDVIAWSGNDFMRVQVKSARLRKQRDRGALTYHHQLGSGRDKKTRPDQRVYDILARVAIDQRRVFFVAACGVNKLSERRSPEFYAQHDLEESSWLRAVEIVKETRNEQR
jgi:hypothetical protein